MAAGAVSFGNDTPNGKLLHPGHKVLYKENYKYAIFSGKINSFGITVGHIGSGTSSAIRDAQDEKVIAEIVHRIEGTIQANDEEFTADISFLKMNCYYTVKNILHVRRFDRNNGTRVNGEYRLTVHKGSVSPGEDVMVLDEGGFMKRGKIKSSVFNWKDKETGKVVINALCIVDNNDQAIANHGQSGALVTSCPHLDSDCLRVYGIVTHIHRNGGTSATIANRLWDVLRLLHDSEQHPTIRLGETLESIDFTDD